MLVSAISQFAIVDCTLFTARKYGTAVVAAVAAGHVAVAPRQTPVNLIRVCLREVEPVTRGLEPDHHERHKINLFQALHPL